MPSYEISIFHPPSAAVGTRLQTKATLYNSTADGQRSSIDNIVWELNQHGTCQISVPITSTGLDDIETADTEIGVFRSDSAGTKKLIWWGIPQRIQQQGDVASVQSLGLTSYLEKRFIGKTRTNIINYGDFESASAITGNQDTGWKENEATDVIDVALVGAGSSTSIPQAITDSTRLLRIMGKTRSVETDVFGNAPASPSDPADYQGPDAQVIQRWTNSSSIAQVYICKAWFYIADDSTYDYKGKPFETRGFYIQEQNSSGTYVSAHQWFPITDDTPRNEWVRAEQRVVIRGGNKGQIRLHVPGGSASPKSAIFWTSVGVFLEESLSFYGGDGKYVTEIIEGINDHCNGQTVNGYTSDKQDLLIDSDPTNSATVPGIRFNVAYQAADHHNAWTEISKFGAIRSTATGSLIDGPMVGTTWSTASSTHKRYLFSRLPSASASTKFDLFLDGSSCNVIDATLSIDGSRIVNKVTALAQGDGPDREEATIKDVSDISIEYEGVVDTGLTATSIKYLDDYAASEVNEKTNLRNSLVVNVAASTEAALNVNGDQWATSPVSGSSALRPGDLVRVTGSFGLMNFSNSTHRVVRMILRPQTEVLTLELNEV